MYRSKKTNLCPIRHIQRAAYYDLKGVFGSAATVACFTNDSFEELFYSITSSRIAGELDCLYGR
jgi:hypothetical protein